jgi:hypothetical protein
MAHLEYSSIKAIRCTDIPMPNDIWEVGAISAPRDFLPFRSIEFVQLMMARNFLDEIVRGSLKGAGFWQKQSLENLATSDLISCMNRQNCLLQIFRKVSGLLRLDIVISAKLH